MLINTKLAREHRQAAQLETRAIYTLLIDGPPDPDTVMTVMVEAKKFTPQCGCKVT